MQVAARQKGKKEWVGVVGKRSSLNVGKLMVIMESNVYFC